MPPPLWGVCRGMGCAREHHPNYVNDQFTVCYKYGDEAPRCFQCMAIRNLRRNVVCIPHSRPSDAAILDHLMRGESPVNAGPTDVYFSALYPNCGLFYTVLIGWCRYGKNIGRLRDSGACWGDAPIQYYIVAPSVQYATPPPPPLVGQGKRFRGACRTELSVRYAHRFPAVRTELGGAY